MAEAREAREDARRRHHDATHHVYACRLLDGTARWDDDGEPSGTAGAPAAEALASAELREAAVIVVRWFGGTELGTGGLRRAYGEVAAAAVERTPAREAAPGRVVTIRYGHPDTGAVMRALEAAGARRRSATWGTRVEMEVAVPLREMAGLERAVRDATAGRAEVSPGENLVLVPL